MARSLRGSAAGARKSGAAVEASAASAARRRCTCATLSARGVGHRSAVAGRSDAHVPAWQVVDADLRIRHGLCAARRMVLGQRTLLWRVSGVGGALSIARADAWLCALSVRCMCLCVVKIAPHLGFALQNVYTFDIFSIPTLTLRARHRLTDSHVSEYCTDSAQR